MPLVQISLLKGKSNDHIRAIADSVHQALTETYEVPIDDRFQLIHQHEPEEFIYDANYLDIQRSKDVVFINILASNWRKHRNEAAALQAFGRVALSERGITAGGCASKSLAQ